ncbi:MAG: DNA-directed RNA polymerase subunit alpha [bacterium]|nr:DNA-directed RNA polymerase subunit alpha [bacterium]
MIPFSKTTKIVSNGDNRGVFEIESLYPGYGTTLGNSLRRVLLSSLGGAAITEVKIKGASHEFATISGIKEDVLGILLNLKQVRFRVFGDGPFTASLKIKGVKVVTARDFKTPSQVEVASKDAPVASLTDKASELDIEVQIGRGVGYESAESRGRGKTEIGSIAMDSIYTPIRRVSYRVEQMRVGDRTDFDRLILEIETDGTVNPEAALKEASGILVGQFQIVQSGLKDDVGEPAEEKKQKAKKVPVKKKPAAKKTAKKK